MHLFFVVAAFIWILLCLVGGMSQMLLVASGAFGAFAVSALMQWVLENFALVRIEIEDDDAE